MIKLLLKIFIHIEEKKKRRYQKLAVAKAIEFQDKAKRMISIYGDQYESILINVAMMICRKEKREALWLYQIHKVCKLKYTNPEPMLFYAMVRKEIYKLNQCQP